MGTEVRAAILRSQEPFGAVVPEVHKNTVSFVAFEKEDEALYVCGMLNSSFVTTYALASSVRGGKSFAGTNLLSSIRIPTYDPDDPNHREMVSLARLAVADPNSVEAGTVDDAASYVWGITPPEVLRVAPPGCLWQ